MTDQIATALFIADTLRNALDPDYLRRIPNSEDVPAPANGGPGKVWNGSSFTTLNANTLYPPETFEPEFLRHIEWEMFGAILSYKSLSTIHNASFPYLVAAGVDAWGTMWEATGDLGYLDSALLLIEARIGLCRPSFTFSSSSAWGDDYLGEEAFNVYENGTKKATGEEIQSEAHLYRIALRLVALIRREGLGQEWQDRANDILSFVEVQIFDKWFNRAKGAQQPGDNILKTTVQIDFYARWGQISGWLRNLTTDPIRRQKCDAIYAGVHGTQVGSVFRSLKAQIRPHPLDASAYWWSEVFGQTTGNGEDISHANLFVSFVVDAVEEHLGEWTDADVAAIRRTLKKLWNGSAANPLFRQFVGGVGTIGTFYMAEGWAKLGQGDADIQKILQMHAPWPGNYRAQWYAHLALNAKRLAE